MKRATPPHRQGRTATKTSIRTNAVKEEEVAGGRPTLTQVQHGHPKLDFDLFFSAQCKRKTQMLFPSYCNIHLTLTIIMRYFPVALYCTSLMVCKTRCAKLHRIWLGTRKKQIGRF